MCGSSAATPRDPRPRFPRSGWRGIPFSAGRWSPSCSVAVGSSARTRPGCCARCSSAGSPRPDRRHVGGRDQRRRDRRRADRRGGRAAGASCGGIDRRLRRARSSPDRDARPHPHPPPRQPRAASDVERGAADAADRGPPGAVPVRRGEHREGRRALVHDRLARRRGPRLGRRPGHPAAGRDRRRALHRRRHRQLDPGRPRRRARRDPDLRHARRPRRPPARATALALGGRDGRVRDRPPPPLPRRPASLPDDVDLHVMPTGQPEAPKYNDLSALRYRIGDDPARASSAPTPRRWPTWTAC